MEGGDHRRREAWGAFLLRSAALRYTKRPPRLGCYEGNSNCRSREGIVVAEQECGLKKRRTSPACSEHVIPGLTHWIR